MWLFRQKALEEKAGKRREEIIARAKLGRDRYRSWAENHQEVLTTLRTLKNDPAGIEYVYTKLPASAQEAGIPYDGRISWYFLRNSF